MWKELDCFVGNRKLKVGVVEDQHEHNESANEEKCLAVALLYVHKADVYEILDTGATPIVTFLQLV